MPNVYWSEQDLLKLIEQGKTKLEIARIQKIGYKTIDGRMHKIDETLLEKAMQKGQAKREVTLQEEQEQILELTRQGKKQGEIAEEMDVKQPDISMRIKEIDKTLVNEAINEAVKKGLRRTSNRTIEIKQEDILERIRNGEIQHKIAKAYNVSDNTISRKISRMPQKLLEDARQEERERKEKENEDILERIKNGESQHKIAKTYNVSDSTMSRRILRMPQKLLEDARQEDERRKQEERERKEKENEDILERIRNGESQHKIAKAYNVSDSTMSIRISRMSQKLVEDARQEEKQKREDEEQEQIAELRKQGKNQTEIAKVLGKSNATISRKIANINTALVEEAKRKADDSSIEIGEIEEKTHKQKKRKMNAKTIQEKMDKKELTKEEVKSYREIIDNKYDKVTMKEVIVLVNAYVKTAQTTEAIRFLNTTINNEDLRYLGLEKLEKAKVQLEQIQKRQMARRLLKDDIRISYIVAQTGLKETEVLALKREIEKGLGRGI